MENVGEQQPFGGHGDYIGNKVGCPDKFPAERLFEQDQCDRQAKADMYRRLQQEPPKRIFHRHFEIEVLCEYFNVVAQSDKMLRYRQFPFAKRCEENVDHWDKKNHREYQQRRDEK